MTVPLAIGLLLASTSKSIIVALAIVCTPIEVKRTATEPGTRLRQPHLDRPIVFSVFFFCFKQGTQRQPVESGASCVHAHGGPVSTHPGIRANIMPSS